MANEKTKVLLFMEQKLLTTDASQTRATGPLHSHLQRSQSFDAGTIPWQRLQLCDRQLTELGGLLLEGGRKMNRRAPQEAPFPESRELPSW